MPSRRTDAMSGCSSSVGASASLLLLAASRALSPASAQDAICSCSPTVFNFVLNLDGLGCEINDIEGNPGIVTTFCFTEEDVAVPAPPNPAPSPPAAAADRCQFCPSGIADPATVLPTEDGETCGSVNDYAATITTADQMCGNIKLAEPFCCVVATAQDDASAAGNSTEPVRNLREVGNNDNDLRPLVLPPRGRRRLQESGQSIVEVVSAQFLEFDMSGDLTVINQDDTYADVQLTDGDRMRFPSASSFLDTSKPLAEQTSSPALVPGGASLILYGKTASGAVVRNRVFWQYDMSCAGDIDPVQGGDEIGWVRVGRESANAWPAFCPALAPGSPTISPRTNEPTLNPSVSPTGSPVPPTPKPTTPRPTPQSSTWGSVITPRPTPQGGWGSGGHAPAFHGKSKSAKAKTPKPPVAKAAKSSKGSKSSKGTKGAKSWNSPDDGHAPMGKAGKGSKGSHGSWWGPGAYNHWRVTGFDAARSAASAPGSSSYGPIVLASLAACFLLFARQ